MKAFLEVIAENWILFIILIAISAVAGAFIFAFIKMPHSAQILKVKEWLLYAVAQAEKELGGGTGQLKLRYVYDMFLAKFTWIAKFIPFSFFSSMVDEVLDKFKDMLSSNQSVKNYVEDKED